MAERTCAVEGCGRVRLARGWCSLHYGRWRSHGTTDAPPTTRRKRPVEERFWPKVNQRGPDDCWLWGAALDNYGYGVFWVAGRNHHAQRIAWELTHGPIPSGAHVLHRCDVRDCCNPAHLFLGSNLDNIADRTAKRRSASGAANGGAKLTPFQVAQARALLAEGRSQTDVGLLLGVSQRTISLIALGRTWRD